MIWVGATEKLEIPLAAGTRSKDEYPALLTSSCFESSFSFASHLRTGQGRNCQKNSEYPESYLPFSISGTSPPFLSIVSPGQRGVYPNAGCARPGQSPAAGPLTLPAGH